MKTVLESGVTHGPPFVIRGGITKNFAYLVAAGRSSRTYDLDVYAPAANGTPAWETVDNNTNSDLLRTTKVANDIPYRVVGSVAGTTIRFAMDGGGDADFFFGPQLTGANQAVRMARGTVETRATKDRFRIETEALGGVRWGVTSSVPARATATIDDDGVVTITALAAGVVNIDITPTDRYGLRAFGGTGNAVAHRIVVTVT